MSGAEEVGTGGFARWLARSGPCRFLAVGLPAAVRRSEEITDGLVELLQSETPVVCFAPPVHAAVSVSRFEEARRRRRLLFGLVLVQTCIGIRKVE